ncbi:MAG: nuclear transport factor 2 family protein [Fulvivirga sp.]|nr:nuclear transport factor 2 family protein [Fulvivirga sp.]
MKKILIVILALSACGPSNEKSADPAPAEIHETLNKWHQAAADADFEAYFAYFENDSAIFMGTDATERWTIAEFRPWSKPYFDKGKAWSFTPVERHIYFSESGTTVWFDESLDTPNLGPSRGTGVLVKTPNGWKIAHYNLSIPIPNELVYDFVPRIDSVLNK